MKDRVLQLGIEAYKKAARYYPILPRMIKVETTKACNLKCIGCRRNFAETLAKAPGPMHLTVEQLRKTMTTLPLRRLSFEGDGEPLCNPYFKDLVMACHRKGVRSGMTTNATLLDKEYVKFLEEEGMWRIHVSVDGATKGTYESMRLGANFDQVIEACGLLGRSQMQLFLNIVPSTEALIGELLDYVDLAKYVGAAGVLMIKFQADQGFGTPINWSEHQGVLEAFKEKVARKGLILTSTSNTGPTFAECENAYTCPYIILTGDVYPCSYMANMRTTEVYLGEVLPSPSPNYVVGNVASCSMQDIWKNAAFREVRATLKASRRRKGFKLDSTHLLELKKNVDGKSRFSYCSGCLCRWSETGI